jgi:hypothetical protein
MSVTIEVVGLVIGFIDKLQIITTSNYGAIANSYTEQFTAVSSAVAW